MGMAGGTALTTVVAIAICLALAGDTRAQAPSWWSNGGQCTAAAVLDQLQLATRTTPPFPGSESTHRIVEGCYWDKHPDKWFRVDPSDPFDPLPRYLTLYICNNCTVPITVGVKDFSNRMVIPGCASDWPETTVDPGESAFTHCETGTHEGASTDYVAYALDEKRQHVGLDPEIVLERSGGGFARLFDLDEVGLAVGNRVVVMGRSQASYVNGMRALGLIVGLQPGVPADRGAPDAFILIAPAAEDAAFVRASLDEYLVPTGRPAPRILMIDAPVTVEARDARLGGAFERVPERNVVRLRRGYVAVELRVRK